MKRHLSPLFSVEKSHRPYCVFHYATLAASLKPYKKLISQQKIRNKRGGIAYAVRAS
jgi:hypothetical protein